MTRYAHELTIEKNSDGTRLTMRVMCESRSGLDALRELQDFFGPVTSYKIVSLMSDIAPTAQAHPFTTDGAYGKLTS